ncbi:hypothetical protein L1285_19440 [Pseudoalteromonas sp. DL2-H2.2]|uniref:hypothetical protein n=1 Tax=Pseudoalteromonas sp. DL2-H2.2 TaxID=2908889 RepID=UPI001F2203F0|nr:hypothetical protein [Pseudoalteromonas sp. DL2-H2.2]MCF2910488.1 hypothetical protein [Pseudoalteromonas sp. DL2-H2.2]
MRYLLGLVILFVLGCAQPPKSAATYANANVGEPDGDKAVLVLYRKTVPPLIYSVTAKVNGNDFATLPNDAFSWTFLTPGKNRIDISWPLLALTPGKTITLDVSPGKYYFVEFGGDIHMAGVGAVAYNTHDVSVISYEAGLADVRECCLYMPSKLPLGLNNKRAESQQSNE